MNTAFNSALKQSTAVRRDLTSLTSGGASTPAALGSLSASLTSFSRTLDEYDELAKHELVLSDYRQQYNVLKEQRDEAQHTQSRTELLGRRPFATSTPENPYANVGAAAAPTGGGQMSMGTGDYSRETHALREQNFFDSTNSALDEYIARGQAVLGDLGAQREMLKNTQKRLYSVANTLGISGDTIRMIERRAKQDKWIFWAGALIFFGFCWLCLHYLR
ncbi:uncharacterized protein PG998_003768 [Apiospora kogelbergensis]|uniref:uncharacterized protein n=1 Tax=Apiospora kogelbergensis TaxID=1337665 RepID=UPI0031326DFF